MWCPLLGVAQKNGLAVTDRPGHMNGLAVAIEGGWGCVGEPLSLPPDPRGFGRDGRVVSQEGQFPGTP